MRRFASVLLVTVVFVLGACTDGESPPVTSTPALAAPTTVSAVTDSDGDGWTDAQELNAGTDPHRVDADSDGYWDPLDPNPVDSNILASGKTPTEGLAAFPISPIPTSPTPAAATPDVQSVVDRWLRAYNGGDSEGLASIYADDVIASVLPFFSIEGKAGVLEGDSQDFAAGVQGALSNPSVVGNRLTADASFTSPRVGTLTSAVEIVVEGGKLSSMIFTLDEESQEKFREAFSSEGGTAPGPSPIPTATPKPPLTQTSPSSDQARFTGATISQTDIPYGPHELQKLDVYYIETFVDAPIVVWVHGGGWMAGNKGFGEEVWSFYNRLGFVLVSTNYRLTTEEGENTFPTPVNDVACAVAWIKKNAAKYGGDGNTLVIMGQSAGAHIGAMLAYNRERNWLEDCGIRDEEIAFKGFIGSGGPYDLAALPLRRWQPGCLLMDLLKLETCGEGDTRWTEGDPGKIAEASPITFVSPGDPPAILATGQKDCLVSLPDPDTGGCTANSLGMAQALDRLGIYNKLLIYAGCGHGAFFGSLYTGEEVADFLTSPTSLESPGGAKVISPRRPCAEN